MDAAGWGIACTVPPWAAAANLPPRGGPQRIPHFLAMGSGATARRSSPNDRHGQLGREDASISAIYGSSCGAIPTTGEGRGGSLEQLHRDQMIRSYDAAVIDKENELKDAAQELASSTRQSDQAGRNAVPVRKQAGAMAAGRATALAESRGVTTLRNGATAMASSRGPVRGRR